MKKLSKDEDFSDFELFPVYALEDDDYVNTENSLSQTVPNVDMSVSVHNLSDNNRVNRSNRYNE